MKNLIKSKIFIGAFLVTYFSFFIFTMVVFDFKRESFGAGNYDYGFPFVYYHSSCFGGGHMWAGLIGNILTAGVFGFFNGIVSTFFWRNHIIPFLQKISSREFRAKWHI